jgi:hypothetical protein
MKYYHITENKQEVIQSILKHGLISESGEIFLFENKSIAKNDIINYVSCLIAANQLFLDEYAMFEIDAEGIVELVPDEVGELTTGTTWIAKQSIINREYINLFGSYKTE